MRRALAGAARRVRRRRVVTTATLVGLAMAVVGAAVVLVLTLSRGTGDPGDGIRGLAWALLAAAAAAILFAWSRAPEPSALARRIDRAGGLDDRVASAWAVLDGSAGGGLSGRVVAEAERALAADPALLERVAPARLPRRLLGVAGRLAAAAVVLLLLAAVARLLPSPFRGDDPGWAPWSRSAATSAGGDREDARPEAGDGPADAAADAAGSGPGHKSGAPVRPDEPAADSADGTATDATATASPAAARTDDGTDDSLPSPPSGPFAEVALDVLGEQRAGRRRYAAIAVRPGPGLAGAAPATLHLVVDGEQHPTGEAPVIAPGTPEGTGAVVVLNDLHGVDLFPGEHVAHAVVVHPDGRREQSVPVRFRVTGPGGDGRGGGQGGGQGGGGGRDHDDGGGASTADDPAAATPPPPPPPAGDGPDEPVAGGDEREAGEDGDEGEGRPPESPPAPEAEDLETVVVVPLFGEGELVEKTGPLLARAPGGGSAPAPAPRRPHGGRDPAGDSAPPPLPEALRRAEAALERLALSEADRAFVATYLRGLRERSVAPATPGGRED